MKIDLRDLFDNYSDPNLDIPDMYAVRNSAADASTVHHAPKALSKRPLLVAAALLLVVTAGLALPFLLSRTTESGAMTEGTPSMESVCDKLPVEISENDLTISANTPVPTQMIEGTMTWNDSHSCHGNLLLVDGTYYTLTDNGAVPIELQNLNTTVELYGIWKLNIDYTVLDGKLVFRDLNPTADESHSDVANAYPVEGSADTVMLAVWRNKPTELDIHVTPYDYKFLYNVFTGEITDPLGSASELYAHGTVTSIRFNSDFSRAIVNVADTVSKVPDKLSGTLVQNWGELCSYTLDLHTGEMAPLLEQILLLVPELEISGSIMVEDGNCRWVDSDTVLLVGLQITPSEGPIDSGQGYLGWDHDYRGDYWMISYNIETEELTFKTKLGAYSQETIGTGDFNQRYFHDALHDGVSYRIIDGLTGTQYIFPRDFEVSLLETEFGSARRILATTKAWDLQGSKLELYLLDDARKGVAVLNIDIPDGDVQALKLATKSWLCIATEKQVYCYYISDDIPITAWMKN